ncbi:MAG TPA: hypothetical protein VG204_02090 [Terriglobia bacterium]|nr:hypothetical protein [Terriglobia bacterium]
MTFILGLKCANGLVLSADSLEGDTVIKRSRNKLELISDSHWSACWGGSGSADIIDKFSDKLRQTVEIELRQRRPYDRNRIELLVETCLKFIKKQYQQRIEIALGLFGRKNGGETHLYRGSSETACLSLEKEYCCVGMDLSIAEFVLKNSHLSSYRVSRGERLAVFVTALMKEYADGVEKETRVLSISHESMKWKPLLDRELEQIEKHNPIRAFENAVARYFIDSEQPYLKAWMEEMNQEELTQKSKQRAILRRQLVSRKSE